MLLILIPIAWLALAALVVLLCRMAGRSDTALAQASEHGPAPLAPIPTVTLGPRARWHEAPRVAGSRVAVSWSARGGGVRSRQGRCIAGS